MAKRKKTATGKNFKRGRKQTEAETTQEESFEPENNGHSDDLVLTKGIPQKTLLDIPDREELPPIPRLGRPCFLVQLVEHNPDLYKEMITKIRHGNYAHVAAMSCGIRKDTFYDWCKKARDQLRESPIPDTFYTRFYNDVMRATAIRRSEIEIELSVADPKLWNSVGPGRLLGPEWTDPEHVPDTPLLDKPGEQPALPNPNVTETKVSSPGDGGAGDSELVDTDIVEGEFIQVTKEVGDGALKELADQGIIELSRSCKSQINKQKE